MQSYPDYDLKVNAFEVGFLMGALEKRRAEVPRIWKQLVELTLKFRKEAGVVMEYLGNDIVRLSNKDGTTIVRELYDWEKP